MKERMPDSPLHVRRSPSCRGPARPDAATPERPTPPATTRTRERDEDPKILAPLGC